MLAVSVLFFGSLISCGPKAKIGEGNSTYNLENNFTDFFGTLTRDGSLKALTIPCQSNNTLRLYYSDSAATLGFPDSFTVVSYGKRTRLGYKECCIEATSSATDTWLSTGSGKVKIKAGTGDIDIDTYGRVWLQHFTSVPMADSTSIICHLEQ